MKILFLDIDGVLNSHETFQERHQAWLKTGEKVKDKVLYSWPLAHLNTPLIERLNAICEATNCFIVISSSWRIICELPNLKKWMAEKGFKFSDQIIDRTANLPLTGEESRRGMEIKEWLDQHKGSVLTYAILDDDSFDIVKIHPKTFVHTDFMTGLQDEQVEKTIKILNAPMFDIDMSTCKYR